MEGLCADKYGFDATEKFNLSDDEAALLANTFSKYDTNSDMRLEFSEFKRLCQDSMFELDDAETKAAMMVLDKRRSGFIEFDECVASLLCPDISPTKLWQPSLSTSCNRCETVCIESLETHMFFGNSHAR